MTLQSKVTLWLHTAACTPQSVNPIPISCTCLWCFGLGKAFVNTSAVCWGSLQLSISTVWSSTVSWAGLWRASTSKWMVMAMSPRACPRRMDPFPWTPSEDKGNVAYPQQLFGRGCCDPHRRHLISVYRPTTAPFSCTSLSKSTCSRLGAAPQRSPRNSA